MLNLIKEPKEWRAAPLFCCLRSFNAIDIAIIVGMNNFILALKARLGEAFTSINSTGRF